MFGPSLSSRVRIAALTLFLLRIQQAVAEPELQTTQAKLINDVETTEIRTYTFPSLHIEPVICNARNEDCKTLAVGIPEITGHVTHLHKSTTTTSATARSTLSIPPLHIAPVVCDASGHCTTIDTHLDISPFPVIVTGTITISPPKKATSISIPSPAPTSTTTETVLPRDIGLLTTCDANGCYTIGIVSTSAPTAERPHTTKRVGVFTTCDAKNCITIDLPALCTSLSDISSPKSVTTTAMGTSTTKIPPGHATICDSTHCVVIGAEAWSTIVDNASAASAPTTTTLAQRPDKGRQPNSILETLCYSGTCFTIGEKIEAQTATSTATEADNPSSTPTTANLLEL